MKFSEKLDQAIMKETALGVPVNESGKRLDIEMSISGRKYEVYRHEDHYSLVKDGKVCFVTEEDQSIESKLLSILLAEIKKSVSGT